MSRMYLPDPLITRSRWICKRLAYVNILHGDGYKKPSPCNSLPRFSFSEVPFIIA